MTRYAITGARLVEGPHSIARDGMTIEWEGERITSVGPDASVALHASTLVVAVGGTVTAGLIDAHVHLCLDATLEGINGVASEAPNLVRQRSFANARRLLAAGITTARDLGSTDGVAIAVSAAQRHGRAIGARIIAAGRGITPSGGHGWMIGVHADGPNAVRAAVAAEIEAGATAIKLFPTGGILGSGTHGAEVTMSPEELAAAVDEAHRSGVLVGAHVIGERGVAAVLDAGIDTIEHAVGITGQQAVRAAADGVALVPTLTAVDRMREAGDALPPDVRARVRDVARVHGETIAAAISAGATVLAGTDAGTPFNAVGDLVHEIGLLAELGLGPGGAIAAATWHTAQALRLDGLGRIEPGAIADLLVVDGDPLAEVSVLGAPRLIIQAGVIVGGL